MAKSNTTLNLAKEIEKISQKYPSQELTLCKGLKQPFNNTNSGSRKIMQGIQMEQATQLLNAEVPIITTGYESALGEVSSNFIKADKDYRVVGKVSKFSQFPNDHYWLILYNEKEKYMTCIERVSYKHISEFYGYLYNNDYLDSRTINSTVDADDVIKKPISFDEYNNKTEGINLTTMYLACEYVKEDPIVISESAAKRFECPLIDKVEVRINDNDILLNLYGEEGNEYKTFPNIGEKVKNSILCALRRELKDEEALFTQSWERLKEVMINDKEFIVDDGGTVIDIDIYCNNPEKLQDSIYNSQIKYYYDETTRFTQEFVNVVKPFLYTENGEPTGVTMSYDLQKAYYRAEGITQGKQYIYDKVFSNIIMNVYVLHVKPLHQGDKITDRYGGKGCISAVLPDNMMPHYLKNNKWVPVDVLYSMCTCINRLNDGQLFETSVTYIGWQLVQYIIQQNLTYDQAFALIYKYISLLNPEQAEELSMMYKFSYGKPDYRIDSPAECEMDDNQFNRDLYIEGILHEGYIMVSMKPISSNMCIDKIREIYHEFPFIQHYCDICVPQKDSNGNYRMVKTRRPVVIGYKYIFRLKQLAEEKFSAVSLASTNIRNENSKSRLSKTHNARFPSTPVRVFGEMESSTLTAHLGIDYFLPEFLVTSASPQARRKHAQLLTGNPFEFNIDIGEDAVSQSADIAQAYLKTLGAKFRFIKIKKFKKRPFLRIPVTFSPRPRKRVIEMIPEEFRDNNDPFYNDYINNTLDFSKSSPMYDYMKEQIKFDQDDRTKNKKDVVKFAPGIKEYRKEYEDYINLNKKLKLT